MDTNERLRERWEKAEASLQRAWDADQRRSTERTAYRAQRAWDAAQRAKFLYQKAVGRAVDDGYADNYEPDEAA
jgi:hypothetical protein